jgi:hypothetical protein
LHINYTSIKQYKEYNQQSQPIAMDEKTIIEPPLYFADENLHIWCAQFHPQQNILATTLINGHIEM